MVRGDHENRAIRDSEPLDLGAQAADLLIDIGYLARVAAEGKADVRDARQPVRQLLPQRQALPEKGRELDQLAADARARLGRQGVVGKAVAVEDQLPGPAPVRVERALQGTHLAGPLGE